jgi:hypothetical protein
MSLNFKSPLQPIAQHLTIVKEYAKNQFLFHQDPQQHESGLQEKFGSNCLQAWA